MILDYRKYIRSKTWKNKRQAFLVNQLSRFGYNFCEICGRKDCNLDVHHISYFNLGFECRRDIQILCDFCHIDKHNIKEVKNEH